MGEGVTRMPSVPFPTPSVKVQRTMSTPGRLSGILLPIFSLRTATDFGIGDFSGLPGLFQWLSAARQRMLMLLPLLPTAPGDPSPYGTRSAFGLNPLFIDLARLPEWKALGGEQALDAAERAQLAAARQSRAHRLRDGLRGQGPRLRPVLPALRGGPGSRAARRVRRLPAQPRRVVAFVRPLLRTLRGEAAPPLVGVARG